MPSIMLKRLLIICRRNYLHQCVNTVRNYSDKANENTQAELQKGTENEKKLAATVESLNKDISELKEKCSDLDVSISKFILA